MGCACSAPADDFDDALEPEAFTGPSRTMLARPKVPSPTPRVFLARGGEDVTSERARTPSGSSSREEARRVSFPESRFHIEHPDPCLSPPRAHLAASRARGHRSVARRGRSRKRVRHPADALENAAWPARGGGGQAHGVPRVARRARGEVRHAVRGRDGRRRRGDDGPRVRRARRARRRHENENEK